MQAVQFAAPARANEPGAHGRQAVLEVAPGFLLYVPGGHFTHKLTDDAPVLSLYVPAGHLMQVFESSYFPASQSLHGDPADGVYLPAMQSRQSDGDDMPS